MRGKYFLRRVASMLIVLACVSSLSFFLVPLLPGDPAFYVVGEDSTPEQRAEARTSLGLDRPLVVQYTDWIGDTLSGDLGESWTVRRGSSVAMLIRERLRATLSLTVLAGAFTAAFAVLTAVLAVRFEGSLLERAITVVTTVGMSTPSFWTGLLLVYLLALTMGWLPAIGYSAFADDPWEWAKHLVMPAVALGFRYGSELSRQLRDTLSATMQTHYIRAARSKGLSGRTVLIKHGVRNAAIPVMTLFGLQVINLLGGSVIVESLFALPGLGTLIIAAVSLRDIPIIQGMVLVFGVIAVMMNFAVDTAYGYLDPRIRTRAAA